MEVLHWYSPVRLAGDEHCDPQASVQSTACTHTWIWPPTSSSRYSWSRSHTQEVHLELEVLGFERGMQFLLQRGVHIELCATDRHVQVRKKHKDAYTTQGIKHEFDVYHLTSHVHKNKESGKKN